MPPQTVSTPAHRKRTPSGGLIWISSNQRPCGENAGTCFIGSLFDWLRSGLLHQLLVIAHTNLSPSPRIRMLAPARYGCPHGGVPVHAKEQQITAWLPLAGTDARMVGCQSLERTADHCVAAPCPASFQCRRRHWLISVFFIH